MLKFPRLTGFRQTIYIDVGSSRIRMGLDGVGIVVDEANLLCRVKKKRWVGVNTPRVANSEIVAWGDKAMAMQHIEPKHLEIVTPVVRGVVVDPGALVEILSRAFSMIMEVPSSKMHLLKPDIVCAVSGLPSSVERRALQQSIIMAGGARVIFVPSLTMWSNLAFGQGGKGVKIVVDIGAEKTEAGVFSESGIVSGSFIKSGGKDIDSNILFYLKMRYGVEVGNRLVSTIKMSMAKEEGQFLVKGKNLGTGMPDVIEIQRQEILEAITLEQSKISRLIKQVVDVCPPSVLEELSSSSGYICGGGGQLYGLTSFLENELKMPFALSEDPVFGLIRSTFLYDKKNK